MDQIGAGLCSPYIKADRQVRPTEGVTRFIASKSTQIREGILHELEDGRGGEI